MPEEPIKFLDLLTQKPIIKILVYTDGVIKNDTSDFSIARMRHLIDTHQPSSAAIDVQLKSRVATSPGDPEVKLTDVLSDKTYNQTWFFGFQQLTREEKNDPKNPSDYSNDEVKTLTTWMTEGGVLMAGDHSEPNPNNISEDHATFLTLGRALGEKVPRAGKLRTWKGPPTILADDSRNTQVQIFGNNLDDPALDKDEFPQLLILETFNPVNGEPLPSFKGGRPHQIFEDSKGRWIRVFPDHVHEGEVVELSGEKLEKWKTENGVAPYTISRGIDLRNGKTYPLLALYNGDRAGVGRIAADSTWHHYLDVNIKEFKEKAAGEDSIINEIGQFYVNLALWLSPLKLRWRMAFYTFHRLAHDPAVLEEMSGEALNIGITARRVLAKEAAPCEIHELLQMTLTNTLREKSENLYLPRAGMAVSPLPSQELVIGSIVKLYNQKLPGIINSSLSDDEKIQQLKELVIIEGFKQAQKAHADQLQQISNVAQSLV